MAILKNPNEINEDVKLAGLLYGQPGVGKTTMGISGPNAVLIDADHGMRRVAKRFQVPSLPLTSYSDFLALLDGKELAPFDSIVIDTLGRFIDRMGDWIMDHNPKMRQPDGSLTLKAYGSIRMEFQRVLRKVKDQGKFLFFVAHEKEEREGDTRYIRPDCPGSAGKDLIKDLDFLGYLEMNGSKRTISFNPTERYYAKNSLGLDAVIDVPDPDKVGNTFLQKYIIDRAIERSKKDEEQNQQYDLLIRMGEDFITTVTDADTALQALVAINAMNVMWDSQRQAKKKLNDKAMALGLVYDKTEKIFKKPVTQPKPEPEVKAAMDAKTQPEVKPDPAPTPAPAAPEEKPPEEKKPAAKAAKLKSGLETMAEALINGIGDCKTEKQLEDYLIAQRDDITDIGSKAALGVQIMVTDAINAKKKEFTPKAA